MAVRAEGGERAVRAGHGFGALRARWARSAAIAGSALATAVTAPAAAEQIEVIRGTESTQHEVGAGAGSASGSHGVEVLIGIEPGSRSVDFETRRYSLSGDERRAIRTRVNGMIELYRSELGIRVPAGFQVELEIHGSGRAYDERAGALRSAAGFYDPATREAVVEGRSARETHETAIHESSHAVLMHALDTAPPLLNEGLAEYFEHIEVGGGTTKVPLDPRRLGWLRRRVERGEAWSVHDLLAMSHPRWRSLPDRASYLAYTQSWAVVAFLMETDPGRTTLRRSLDDIRRGRAPVEALGRHHRGGLERLEADWIAWLATAPRSHRF